MRSSRSARREGAPGEEGTYVSKASSAEDGSRVVEETARERKQVSGKSGRKEAENGNKGRADDAPVPSRELLTEEDDRRGEDATEVLGSGENGAETTDDGRVNLLERDGDLGGKLDGLELKVKLVLGRLGVDFAKRLHRAFQIPNQDGKARRFGHPVHRSALEDGEREGEGEDDAPSVVDVLETGSDGVSDHLTASDHTVS